MQGAERADALSEAGSSPGLSARGSTYALALLTLVLVFNSLDRSLVAVLAEPIKRDFGLTDFQFGLLGGPAFAFAYCLLTLPIARLADRGSRTTVIAATLAVWSALTMVCGLATQYWQLFIARMGVGCGEAGCNPAASSMLSDLFPPERRATAFGIFSLGVPIGTFLAAVSGGWIAQSADWRLVFIVVGAPGILLALVVRVTLRDPPRRDEGTASLSYREGLRQLADKSTFIHLVAAAIVGGMATLGLVQFLNAYLIRVRGLDPMEASLDFGLLAGIGIGIGSYLGGVAVDWLGRRIGHAEALVGAIGFGLAAPLYLLALRASDTTALLALMFPAMAGIGVFFTVLVACSQAIATPATRATATALMVLASQFFGGVLGPPLLGRLSDRFGSSAAGGSAHGLQTALELWTLGLVWAAIHFLLATRTLSRDRTEPLSRL
jgi:predicted MFS family arabinose efflux permease